MLVCTVTICIIFKSVGLKQPKSSLKLFLLAELSELQRRQATQCALSFFDSKEEEFFLELIEKV